MFKEPLPSASEVLNLKMEVALAKLTLHQPRNPLSQNFGTSPGAVFEFVFPF